MSKLRAFTFVELVVIFLVIGFFVIFTMSATNSGKFQEQSYIVRAKKTLNLIDQSTTVVLNNHTSDMSFDGLVELKTSAPFHASAEDLEASRKLADIYKLYLSSITDETDVHLGDFNFLLEDGTAIGITFKPSTFKMFFPGENLPVNVASDYGYISYDVNDGKAPNMLGKDVFRIPFGRDGIEYNPTVSTEEPKI